jgi:predicted dehydrogenase
VEHFNLAIIGFGNIAYGLALDLDFKRSYRVATHVEAIKLNKALELTAVVEPDAQKRKIAKKKFPNTEVVGSITEISAPAAIDIVVVTKPSENDRLEILKYFTNLVGTVLEKPIGANLEETREICEYVAEKQVKVAVPYLRRYDKYLQTLDLRGNIGSIQCANIVYGGGLANNGSHYLDLVDMLLGEIVVGPLLGNGHGSFKSSDGRGAAVLSTSDGIPITIASIDFSVFRENSLDVWGRNGRWALCQEGSSFVEWKPVASRFGMGLKELDWSNSAQSGETLIGESFAGMYQDLITAVVENRRPISNELNALRVETIVNYLS